MTRRVAGGPMTMAWTAIQAPQSQRSDSTPKTRKSNCAHAIHRPRPFDRSRSGRVRAELMDPGARDDRGEPLEEL